MNESPTSRRKKGPVKLPWLRLYSEILQDAKVQGLPAETFKRWVNLLALANDGAVRGLLPDIAEIAFRLRLTETQTRRTIDILIEAKLLDETPHGLTPHGWDRRQFESDNVAARVQKYRERQRQALSAAPVNDECNVTNNVSGNDGETLPVTAPEQNRPEHKRKEQKDTPQPPRRGGFQGRLGEPNCPPPQLPVFVAPPGFDAIYERKGGHRDA